MNIFAICLLVPVAGLTWLLFRRCQFSLAQIFVALLAFGLAMSITLQYISQFEQEERMIFWAVIHFVSLMLGLFLGVRNVHSLSPQAGLLRRWFCFMCGLSIVYAIAGCLGSLYEITVIPDLGACGVLSLLGLSHVCGGMIIVTALQFDAGRKKSEQPC